MARSRSRGSRSVTSRSPIVIVPPEIVSRPASMRRSVVLPQPDGPTRTMNSPLSIVRLTSSTAVTPPGKTFVTSSNAIRLNLRHRLRCRDQNVRALPVRSSELTGRRVGLHIEALWGRITLAHVDDHLCGRGRRPLPDVALPRRLGRDEPRARLLGRL